MKSEGLGSLFSNRGTAHRMKLVDKWRTAREKGKILANLVRDVSSYETLLEHKVTSLNEHGTELSNMRGVSLNQFSLRYCKYAEHTLGCIQTFTRVGCYGVKRNDEGCNTKKGWGRGNRTWENVLPPSSLIFCGLYKDNAVSFFRMQFWVA